VRKVVPWGLLRWVRSAAVQGAFAANARGASAVRGEAAWPVLIFGNAIRK
jgi:hypothetical protein